VYQAPNTLDPATQTRSYSATAYFLPNQSRANLTVLTSAYACKIVTSGEGNVTATGVEFTHGKEPVTHIANAKNEVILCTGALKSPQLLELSGIGRPDILDALKIPVKVALHGVGENVQEHQYAGVTFALKDGLPDETFDILRNPDELVKQIDLHAQGKGVFTMGMTTFAFRPLSAFSPHAENIYKATRIEIENNIKAGKYSKGLAEQYAIELERFDRNASGAEFIGFPGILSRPNPGLPGKKYFTIVICSNHGFSRGTIHATSKDPAADPEFHPRYFEHDIDLQYFIEMVKFAREVAKHSPFKDVLDAEVVELNPGPEVQTDAQIADWVKDFSGSTFHTIGSLSMLPLDKGGVVDPQLKVYGTTNIRCADLSIVPLHFSAHSLATAYTIGEKAADIIKGKA